MLNFLHRWTMIPQPSRYIIQCSYHVFIYSIVCVDENCQAAIVSSNLTRLQLEKPGQKLELFNETSLFPVCYICWHYANVWFATISNNQNYRLKKFFFVINIKQLLGQQYTKISCLESIIGNILKSLIINFDFES